MDPLWVHMQESWAIAHEPGKSSFEDETEVQGPVGHSLLDERVTSGLGDDQIGPLDNDDRDEIGGLAGVFKDLSVGIGTRIPLSTELVEIPWHESVVSHDPEVGEESSGGLDHTDLSVGDGLFGYIRSSNSHSNSDIGLLQSWRIVDSVSGDSHNLTLLLESFDDHELLLWGGTSKDNFRVILDDLGKLILGHLTKIRSVDNGGLGFTWVDFLNWNSTTDSNILNSLGSLRNDSDGLGNSLSSNWVISGNHDDLDSSRTALSDGIWDSGTGWINHRHKSNESQVLQWEVDLLNVEFESFREFVGWQNKVTESKNTFSHSSQLEVGVIELLTEFVGEFNFLSVQEDGRADIQNSLWSSLHHKQVVISVVVNRDLVLVGGVEWNFSNLWISFTNSEYVSLGEFGELKKGDLGSISGTITTKNWGVLLSSLELGTVTEGGDANESLKTDSLEKELNKIETNLKTSSGSLFLADLSLGGVTLVDGLIVPHILDEAILAGHSLGGECKTHGNGGDQSFWYVGDDNTDEENDSGKPMVSKDEGDDEEGDTKEDGDSSDKMDEMLDFTSNWGHSGVKS
ncbi:hypothetical protein GCK72_017702 [Caenorhabditis remanei]|uniref:Uncharacterized protein n=1 Tax=Caenorhabditis remanei TaxID=31234 RepID=A0A6A5G7T4_CAERE|nr:hypothetical protein GCK72_017702 [Caenorhabditis remanei]KAF1751148.1 hypothetical protein GCK72_017702 [Caenorhabditis remanei]